MKIKEILAHYYRYLEQKNVQEPYVSAQKILSFILKISRGDLFLYFDLPLNKQQLIDIKKMMKRRAQGEPLEYIIQEVEFYHSHFFINSDVLIPRVETEILVDHVAKILDQEGRKKAVLWDICCGSGCIGISLKKRIEWLNVVLSDISPKALSLARRNAKHNRVEVEYKEGDLLSSFTGEKADFVVCNPPYVSEKEYYLLDREVRDFEPKLALVGGCTGLEIYERLAKSLHDFLNPGAKIFFEMGEKQGNHIENLFFQPCWKNKKIMYDWAGKKRFFSLEFE